MLLPHWKNPMWKAWRIITFFTAASTLVCLIGFAAAGRSWLPSLWITVGVNIIANVALLFSGWRLRNDDGTVDTAQDAEI